MCLWGEFAREVKIQQGHAYAIRNIKVKRFGEQTYLIWENYTKIISEVPSDQWIKWALPPQQPANATSNGQLHDPTFAQPIQANQLATRYVPEMMDTSQDSEMNEKPMLSISEVNRKCEEFFADPFNKYQKLVLEFYGYINHMSKNIWYESCGLKNCKKKITELDNQKKYCGKCKMTIANPITRFMADVKVVDGNDKIFGRIFGEDNCVNIFGKAITDIKQVKYVDEEEFYRILKEVEYAEFFFKILVRNSEYQGETRIAVEFLNVQRIEPMADHMAHRVIEILEYQE